MNRPKRPHELLIWEHLDRTERELYSWLDDRVEKLWGEVNDLHRMAKENQYAKLDELKPQIEERNARWFEGKQIQFKILELWTSRQMTRNQINFLNREK